MATPTPGGRRDHGTRSAALLLMLLLATAMSAASCPPLWSDQFPGGGLEGADALAGVTFDDDGAGPSPPSLFVGGTFMTAGGQFVNRIARYDGERWHALDTGVEGTVRALTIFDDDGDGPAPPALIVGGDFSIAGDVSAAMVARWDGASWSPLGEGLPMAVHALATFDEDGDGPLPPALFAAGAMQERGEGPRFALARWDGRAWSLIGPGTDGTVNALGVFDSDGEGPLGPRLIAGGEFGTIGGITAAKIAAWDGRAWSTLGAGIGGEASEVNALAVYDEDGPGPASARLIAGGTFTAAGAVAASAIASWNGAQWAALGTGLHDGIDPAAVFSLAVFDDDGDGPHDPRLIVAGDFNGAGIDPANGLARWNGEVWAALTETIIGDFTLATVFMPQGPSAPSQLFVGGTIFTPAGLGDDNFYRWNGQVLAPLGRGVNNQVNAIAVASEAASDSVSEAVYVGGRFIWAGDLPVGRMARWDGEAWSALGSGVTGEVFALRAVDDDSDGRTPEALYAGGSFNLAGGIMVNRIARWDGSEWSALDNGVTLGGPVIGAASVRALASHDPDGPGPAVPQIYAGGEFSFAGATPAKNIARWNGSDWFALGAGVNDLVTALAFFDEDGDEATIPALFAGGEFGMAGGATAAFLARWNNGAWSPVAGGLDGPVRALIVFDEDDDGPLPPALIVGGQFSQAGAIAALNMARWDGRDWSPLGDGVSDEVAALAVADLDGAGPQPPRLIAGGEFTHSGSVLLNHAGVWNGRAWSPLGEGADGTVRAIAAFRDSSVDPSRQAVFLGGVFQSGGGLSADRITRWGCAMDAPASCTGDVSGDGIVNGFDLALLLAMWGDCPPSLPGRGLGGGSNRSTIAPCPADLDGNGTVDGIDLALLLAAWGPC